MTILRRKASFGSSVQKACESACVSVGFEKRYGVLNVQLDTRFLGWLGLNKGGRGDFSRVNPFVGLHCVPIMKLCSELVGERYQKGRIATVALHLGEICPDEWAFEFSFGKTDIDAEAARLAHTVMTYGVPYMREHASIEKILPIMLKKVPMLGGFPERVAVAYHLLGDNEKARSFILEHQAEVHADTVVDSYANEHLDPFVRAFLKHIG